MGSTTMSLSHTAPHRLFTAAEVLSMVEAGILGEDEPFELLDGDLVEVTRQGPPHAGLVAELVNRLSALTGPALSLRPALPLECGAKSLPEPDLALVTGTSAEFRRRHPRGDEAILVIEIARTSLALDRFKASIYAGASVPVYWLINLSSSRIEVHEQPLPDGQYGLVRVLGGKETVTVPGTSITWSVDELLL